MKITELNDEVLMNLVKTLLRQSEASKVFYYCPTNPLGQPQYGGYAYSYTRQEVFEEYGRRDL